MQIDNGGCQAKPTVAAAIIALVRYVAQVVTQSSYIVCHKDVKDGEVRGTIGIKPVQTA